MAITELRERGADWSRLKNDRQRKHLLEVLKDPNRDWTAAAIRVGYAKKSAHVTASRLKNNPVVKAIIGKIERQDVEKLELDRLEVVRQLYYALTRQVKNFFDENGKPLKPHELPKHCQSIVDGVETKITTRTYADGTVEEEFDHKYRVTPHATARDQAMKHKGLFKPEVIHQHGGVVVQILANDREDLPSEEEKALDVGFEE